MTFLRNIGADLVEKRLWPVALALIVGIVAVPTLGSSSSNEPAGDQPSAAVASATAGGAKAVTLNTKPVGRRARGGSSKNPFKQLFVPKVVDVTTAPAQTESGSPAKDGGSTDNGGNTGATPKSNKKSTPKSSTTVYRATLRFGQPGSMRTISDIPRLTPLPSIESPFFVFLGVKEDGKTLVFLVSSDAKATGDGKCQPKDTCETIEMQAGDTEIFDSRPTTAASSSTRWTSSRSARSRPALRRLRARHARVIRRPARRC